MKLISSSKNGYEIQSEKWNENIKYYTTIQSTLILFTLTYRLSTPYLTAHGLSALKQRMRKRG